MRSFLGVATLIIAPIVSLLLTTLTYTLRELSKVRLAEELGKRGQDRWYEPTLKHTGDLYFITGSGRLIANLVLLIALIDLCRNIRGTSEPDALEYLIAVIAATVILVGVSLALPRAISTHAGEAVLARCLKPLHSMRAIFAPVAKLMQAAERLVLRARPTSTTGVDTESLVQEEILDAVSEGERTGVVDDRERALIERVMDFRSATVDDVMTTRQHIEALPLTASVDQLLQKIESSGYSRIPIYVDSVDKIIGVLYARDLLKHVGELNRPESFNLRGMLRAPLFVPRTKALRDLLQDFRLQKVHIAIVLDEYGGTAGLITIEDIMEQLVGDISDEHEPTEPTMYKRLDDNRAEVDARIEIEDLNRLIGLNLPEDEEYETLGGYVTKTLERIPSPGATFEAHGARFTVLESEPTRVVRVRVEVQQKQAT